MTSDDLRFPRVRYGADYSATNPYQTLLYRAVGCTVDARPCSPAEALGEAAEQPGTLIYHLHWEEHVLRSGSSTERRERLQGLLDGLESLRARGAHVVWTRHNRRPHDASLAELHAEAVPHLTAIASVVHVHSWSALEEVARHDRVEPAKTVVIGHGNYIGHYPEWPATEARKRLALPEDAHVFLTFGRLAAYKQAARAAAAFAALEAPDARLLIVGEKADPALDSLPSDPRIALIEGFVPHDHAGLYHAAADTVLLPYTEVLTSGAAMLAASLGRGVLGTDTAGLRDLVEPGGTGLLYDRLEPQALERALRAAVAEGRAVWQARGARALAMTACRDWAIPGRQWRDLFHALARTPSRERTAAARIAPA